MYIVYNKKQKEFRLYLEGDYDWTNLINKYKKHNKPIWIWNDTENCFCSKVKTVIAKVYYEYFIDKKEIENIYIYSKEYNKNYRKNNFDKIKVNKKIWRNNNIEKIKKHYKKYRNNNFNKIRNVQKEWIKNNIAQYLLSSSKRKKKPNDLTVKDIEKKLEEIRRDDGRCYCQVSGIRLNINNSKMKNNSFSIDRVDNNGIYTFNNIAIISYGINRIKNNITLEFAYKLREYFELGLAGKLPKQENHYVVDNKERMRRYWGLKSNAKQRGTKFLLTPQDFMFPNIDFFGFLISIKKHCPRNEQLSCDRINPFNNYEKNNIYWISMKANIMKNNINPQLLEKIILYMEKKQCI